MLRRPLGTGPEYLEILIHCRALPLVALFRTRSAAVYGVDAHLIDVEVDMYPAGTNREIITVGMPDTAVKESRAHQVCAHQLRLSLSGQQRHRESGSGEREEGRQ